MTTSTSANVTTSEPPSFATAEETTTTGGPATTDRVTTSLGSAESNQIAEYEEMVQDYVSQVHVVMDPIVAGSIGSEEEFLTALEELNASTAEALQELETQDVPGVHEASHALLLSALQKFSSGSAATLEGYEKGLLSKVQFGATELEKGTAGTNAWLEAYLLEVEE